tara:strand:- start:92 stop:334 length:243 start_codon:yes stop_codon:yes gene_type:complete
MKILIEAVVIGLATIVIGTIVGYIVGRNLSVDLPTLCKKWNKNHVMEISLFFTGFFLHLICEYSGINHWYCKFGNACMSK